MSGVSSAERWSVRSATSMTSKQWSLDWGLCGSPPPLFPTKTTYASIHIHSCLLPVIFACLSFQLLPSLIVTQLGMSDQGSWERTKASLLAARLEAVWTQTPERHTEQNNCDNNKGKNQNGAKERSWAEKGNKGKHISALTILLLSRKLFSKIEHVTLRYNTAELVSAFSSLSWKCSNGRHLETTTIQTS